MLRAITEAWADGVCVRRCLKVAAVVGTILTLINHGDVLAAGDLSALLGIKMALNYVVPFLVCSTGYATAMRRGPGSQPTG